jgi:SynChlorMet cassette protein ScmD
MQGKEKFVANPAVVIRDDFDDKAVLYNPETGQAFGLNPVGTMIWSLLHKETSINDLVEILGESCFDMAENATEQIQDFIDSMKSNGLVGSKAIN